MAALVHWRTSGLKEKEGRAQEAACMLMMDRWALERGWKAVRGTLTELKQRGSQANDALVFFDAQGLAGGVRIWRFWLTTRNKFKKQRRRIVGRMQNRVVVQAWNAWYDGATSQKLIRQKAREAYIRMERLGEAVMLEHWHESVLLRLAQKERLREALDAMGERGLCIRLVTWRYVAKTLRDVQGRHKARNRCLLLP